MAAHYRPGNVSGMMEHKTKIEVKCVILWYSYASILCKGTTDMSFTKVIISYEVWIPQWVLLMYYSYMCPHHPIQLPSYLMFT